MARLSITPVTMPRDLDGKTNGKLPATALTAVPGGGQLHHLAARAWAALRSAAWDEVGLPLTFSYGGTYRPYTAQETLFRSRYSPTGQGGGCKTWNGQRWCKKSSNLATAATPGASNHGWGLAIDAAWDSDLTDGIGPDDATYIESHPGWSWLLANAERFGFSWELQSEPWHLRYVTGDNVPAAVLAFERPAKPDPTPDPEEDNMNPKPVALLRMDGQLAVYAQTSIGKWWVDSEDTLTTLRSIYGMDVQVIPAGWNGLMSASGPIVGPIPPGTDAYGRPAA